jgi:hypothetical protein
VCFCWCALSCVCCEPIIQKHAQILTNNTAKKQDAAKLEPGAFYLDRKPQAQHLTLAKTRHSDAAADEMAERLLALAGWAGAA